MALESVFVCSRTIGALRSGPLGKLLDGYCDWLLGSGFKKTTVRTHLTNVSRLNAYLAMQKRREWPAISAEDLSKFSENYHSLACNRRFSKYHVRRVQWSINRFICYLRLQKLFEPPLNPPIYQPLLDAYLEWMRDYRHAASGTLDIRSHCLGKFLQWLGPQATPEGLQRLTSETVEQFFLSYCRNKGRAGRRSMQSALRTFFRFCLYQDYIQQQLDLSVPTLRTYKLATVPRGLTDEEARKVLDGIARGGDAGQRDYAICQLLYTYGVRGGQVRALRLEDIDWTNDLILFKALKHGKDSLLPLTVEVGQSLLSYLQNARPLCRYQEVFLTARAPYQPLRNSSTLAAIVDRHIRAAGIDSHAKGAYVFRHGFATRMLQEGHSLKKVADVLGHRHLATTFIYAKVDFNALKQVGLAWPREVK
jgi:site-specific recombinase XerD